MSRNKRLRILRRNINAAVVARNDRKQSRLTCPIAQALTELGYSNPVVNYKTWFANDSKASGTICEDGQKFISAFDGYQNPGPQRVTITID